MKTEQIHIAMVAGEHSGDLIAAPLYAELRRRFPAAHFSGVGGPALTALGFPSLINMERLAVMGLVEVLRHLPDLWAAKRSLLRYWAEHPPTLFIGIDAPAFNLPLAATLHRRGTKTVHYVSPSLWAWKAGRIHKIKRAIDLMLCLFPFETEIYRTAGVPALAVGHPMRERLPRLSQAEARAELGLPATAKILGIFPGSRAGERARLGPVFRAVAQSLQADGYQILTQPAPDLPADFLVRSGDSARLMLASDVLLLKSGTITLEAALLGRPMVVGHRVNPLTAAIARRLLTVKRFALPNILLGADVVPELIQEHCTVPELVAALRQLDGPAQRAACQRLNELLPVNASATAAAAIATLLERPC